MFNLHLGLLTGSVFSLLYICYLAIKPTKYWAKRNVAHVRGYLFIGNIQENLIKDLYNKFPDNRYIGYMQFSTPALLIKDVHLIKEICVNGFHNLYGNLNFANCECDPLISKTVLFQFGDNWQPLRDTLNPCFTRTSVQDMYHLMAECAENLVNHYEGQTRAVVDVDDVFYKFTNDMIASTAFGLQVDSIRNPENLFYDMALRLHEVQKAMAFKMCMLRKLKLIKLAKVLRINLLPKDISTYFTSIIKSSINRRVNEGTVRPDLIQLMLDARRGNLQAQGREGCPIGSVELTDDHIVAQALLFILVGLEEISRVTALMAYELSHHTLIQKKLQQEIDAAEIKYDGRITYKSIMSMKYLDQVICESLRMWAPWSQTDRYCDRDYTIPPKHPGEKVLILEKGTMITVPIACLHHDPKYFPMPDRFYPERFKSVHSSDIPLGAFMPFGLGPRSCIGSNVAILGMKTLFVHLLSKFDIVRTVDTGVRSQINPDVLPENWSLLALQRRHIL